MKATVKAQEGDALFSVWLHPAVHGSAEEAVDFVQSLSELPRFSPSNVHAVYRALFDGLDCIFKVSLPHRTVRRSQQERFEKLVEIHVSGAEWLPMPVMLVEQESTGKIQSYCFAHRFAEGRTARSVLAGNSQAIAALLPKIRALIAEQSEAGVHSTDFTTANILMADDGSLRLIDLDAIALEPPGDRTLPKMLANLRLPLGAIKTLLKQANHDCGTSVTLGKYVVARYLLLPLRDFERHPRTRALKRAVKRALGRK